MKKYFTTPIYYVNDVPHIGHAYCTLATDTLVRYWRRRIGRDNVFFLTGTDENSQKTVEAAVKSGQDIESYLSDMASVWRDTWERLGVSFDDFIRTTEDRHVEAVHEIFDKIYAKGDIYKGVYKGRYCTGCEAFLKESEVDGEGHCPHHKRAPEMLEEANYFFKLSRYEKPLLKFFEANETFLLPLSRRHEILNFIRSGLEDISISRETAAFGISLPIDPSHKIYVWFDALINYISGVKEKDFWPATHIIGKDITRFHAVIWPAMLMSAGIESPRQIFAHGFFTIDGHKMSKSVGNVVSPLDLAAKYGNDALRIGLLSCFEFGGDGDFSLPHFSDFYRMKLAGGVGNLFHRVTILMHKFLNGEKPKLESRYKKAETLKRFDVFFEHYQIREAVELYFQTVSEANQLLNETEVWKMAKVDLDQAFQVFSDLVAYLEVLTEMAEILLPESYLKMQKIMGGAVLGVSEILFDQK